MDDARHLPGFNLLKSFCLVTTLFFVSCASVMANTFIFNPRTHSYTAINDNGRVVKSGRASGGRSWCSDIRRSCRTPSGYYHIQSKGGPGCRSSRYPVGRGGAPMPYCMFFSRYYAIHGSPDVPNYNASHGCIRVRPADAHWLSKNFIRIGTRVIVKPY
ncbi:enhanced entry protein EnhA [Legionella geestiana]|uniref:Enhanced entry protein EnhA n=1 Tax=Legionella geestiana TaxID=45065 RepID=A0A0W0TZ18_9GAMM|nr:L,D-transpeptidase [Legionella geestiana]KTD00703.1 enhanced entry protein EnhA [Legionella geestiana]QBS11564.1 L,D-transpeptidase [Legionella geestiana]QDQ40828.1 L,D-transpeptidase [Legionella geestiana]STX53762.1 enhanced entry protein EnhA [Legionella geestiana]